MEKEILVPPDGRYGWIIVLASALNNFFVIPLLQNAGMIFEDTFKQVGMSATEGSIVLTLNSAFGMLMGLINGALLNRFGYRKVSVVGAAFISGGLILTSFVKSFSGYLLTYGFITSIGVGLNTSSYNLAINTYFSENKSKAVGLSMTLTAFGPIIMPQVVNILIQNYSFQGVTLILGAICANSFVAAALLQPIKWHMVEKSPDININHKIKKGEEAKDDVQTSSLPLVRSIPRVDSKRRLNRFRRKDSSFSISYEQETAGIMGMDSTLGGSVYSLESVGLRGVSLTSSNLNKTKTQWWKSASTVNLESSYDIFDEKSKSDESQENQFKEKNTKARWAYLVELFDLTILKDPVYVNIMIGLSLAIFAESNFSVLTAFILSDFGLDTSEIATFLSCLGTADILLRFFAPFIGDCLNLSPRVLYLLSLGALIVARFGLVVQSNYTVLLAIAVALGSAKGVRIIYMSLVIPTYVPLERLAAASGIQMMVNGLFLITGGSLIGYIRDLSGDYKICIVIMNAITFTTIVLWTIELVWLRLKDNNKKKTERISDIEM